MGETEGRGEEKRLILTGSRFDAYLDSTGLRVQAPSFADTQISTDSVGNLPAGWVENGPA